jgi:phosphatidylserine/phosphatidylglycerophosphate/cardiolipin synthase-like enzyme
VFDQKKGMMKVGIFLIFLIALTCVFLWLQMRRSKPSLRMQELVHNNIPNVLRKIREHELFDVPIIALPTSNHLNKAWTEMIRGAKSSIWFSTFVMHVWRYEKTNAQIHFIGEALKYADENADGRIKLNLVMNETFMETRSQEHKLWWRQIFYYWKHVNEVKFDNIDVELRFHKHKLFDNVHGKVCIVDDEYTVVSSSNIEVETQGKPNGWNDCGLFVHSVPFSCYMRDEGLGLYWKSAYDATDLFREENLYPEIQKAELHPLPNLPSPDKARVAPIVDHKNSNIFNGDFRTSETLAVLLDMVKSAKTSIDILTPTFNLTILWNALLNQCKTYPDLRVRIILAWEFNTSHPFIQRYLTGYRVNREFLTEVEHHPQMQVRWCSSPNGELAHRHSGPICHAKGMFVDGQRGLTGSFNFDVWSALNSHELSVYFESRKVCNDFRSLYFDKVWDQFVPVDKNNLKLRI